MSHIFMDEYFFALPYEDKAICVWVKSLTRRDHDFIGTVKVLLFSASLRRPDLQYDHS